MFGDFDIDDFDIDDLANYQPEYEPSEHWTTKDGKRIKYEDMTVAHIRNAMAMLSRTQGYEQACANPKYLRLQEELAVRSRNVIIVKREFRITKGMLIKLMRSQGIELPIGNNGCGFYVNSSFAQGISIEEVIARWDTDEPIKGNNASKNRNRGTTKQTVSRRRSTKRG